MGIQTDIQAELEQFPPSMRRIAAAILESPRIVLEQTITELAATCETSETTVVRFCRALGYAGYAPLRLAMASQLGTEQGRSGRSGGHGADISPTDGPAEVVAKVTRALVHGVEETAATVDPLELQAVADAVATHDRVLLFGVGASGLVAHDLQQKLLRIGVVALSFHDAHDALVAAAGLGEGAVAIGLSHSGRTRETVEFLRSARAVGAVTVGVTNVASSPLAQLCDHLLRTAVLETTFRSGAMASRTAQLALVDFIFVLVAQRDYVATVQALADTYETVRVLRDDR